MKMVRIPLNIALHWQYKETQKTRLWSSVLVPTWSGADGDEGDDSASSVVPDERGWHDVPTWQHHLHPHTIIYTLSTTHTRYYLHIALDNVLIWMINNVPRMYPNPISPPKLPNWISIKLLHMLHPIVCSIGDWKY